jgi:5-methylcytosine-specific restriction endonuclease McrA
LLSSGPLSEWRMIENYEEHMASPYWKQVSKAVIARADGRCQTCNSTEYLQAHHRTYEHFGQEADFMNDLTCLCSRCHFVFHRIADTPRRPKAPKAVKPRTPKKPPIPSLDDLLADPGSGFCIGDRAFRYRGWKGRQRARQSAS